MDLQLEIAVVEMAHNDGVVEIARCLSVDSDDGQGAEVAAMVKFCRRDDGWDVLRLFQRGCGKMMRQMELADGDLDVDAEVVLPSQNLNDSAPRTLRGRWPVSNLNVNHHAFKVIPLRASSGLITQHAVDGFLQRRRPAGF